jgi:hypothetical protein
MGAPFVRLLRSVLADYVEVIELVAPTRHHSSSLLLDEIHERFSNRQQQCVERCESGLVHLAAGLDISDRGIWALPAAGAGDAQRIQFRG